MHLELEAIAPPRDIPTPLSSLISPVVIHSQIQSLTITLRQTRDAVSSLRGYVERLA